MKYFSYNKEAIGCPCGCGAKLSNATEQAIDKVRELYGKPVYIEQGATCKYYSVMRVGRKETSTHIDNGEGSLALDIKHKTFSSKEDFFFFLECARKAGFTGFGIGVGNYDIHKKDARLHIDIRDTPDIVTWVYYDKE